MQSGERYSQGKGLISVSCWLRMAAGATTVTKMRFSLLQPVTRYEKTVLLRFAILLLSPCARPYVYRPAHAACF
jgi:hypothetical protein